MKHLEIIAHQDDWVWNSQKLRELPSEKDVQHGGILQGKQDTALKLLSPGKLSSIYLRIELNNLGTSKDRIRLMFIHLFDIHCLVVLICLIFIYIVFVNTYDSSRCKWRKLIDWKPFFVKLIWKFVPFFPIARYFLNHMQNANVFVWYGVLIMQEVYETVYAV